MKKELFLVAFFLILSLPLTLAVTSQNYGIKATATWNEQENYIKVDITNVDANSPSYLFVGASCTNKFSQSGTGWTISDLNKGETKSAYLTILGGEGLNSICNVSVSDANQPNNKISLQVLVSTKEIKICNQGDQRMVNSENAIQECQNNVWTTIKICPENQSPNYINNQLQCTDNYSQNQSWIIYVVILALIVLLILGDIFFKKFKIKRR